MNAMGKNMYTPEHWTVGLCQPMTRLELDGVERMLRKRLTSGEHCINLSSDTVLKLVNAASRSVGQ